jgi:hypothetical protein
VQMSVAPKVRTVDDAGQTIMCSLAVLGEEARTWASAMAKARRHVRGGNGSLATPASVKAHSACVCLCGSQCGPRNRRASSSRRNCHAQIVCCCSRPRLAVVPIGRTCSR